MGNVCSCLLPPGIVPTLAKREFGFTWCIAGTIMSTERMCHTSIYYNAE